MQPRLQRVAIIGGSSGIGRATARMFAAEGAEVWLFARGEERLRRAVEEIRQQGGKGEGFVLDVSDEKDVQEMAQQLQRRDGGLDVLIYSAGQFYAAPAEEMNISRARQVMESNYWGALHVVRAFLPLLRQGKGKSLVFLSSLAAACTPAYFTAYAASKHALRGFVLALRQELRREGIHVGMVAPGPVDTPLIAEDLHGEYYPLPPGIPILTAEQVAAGIMRTVKKRKEEVVLPRRLAPAARLAQAFPSLVERYYRWTKTLLFQEK